MNLMDRNYKLTSYELMFKALVDKKKISAKKYAKYMADLDTGDTTDIDDEIDASPQILTYGWCDETPIGGGGALWVHCWHGLYFIKSIDYDRMGPFESLDDVLATEYFCGGTPNPELYSDVLPLEKLLSIGTTMMQESENEYETDFISINDIRYILRNGKLVKSEEET